MYAYVRGRQLEGTYSGDPSIGVWPITDLRLRYGWGVPSESAWPYDGDRGHWPPKREPDGIDLLARQNRIAGYQRVVSARDCKFALAGGNPVTASFEITDDWFTAPDGRIPFPTARSKAAGVHAVALVGHSEEAGEFKFVNSWGTRWGASGFGTIPYEVFEQTWIEGWVPEIGQQPPPARSAQVTEVAWGTLDFCQQIRHHYQLIGAPDERIGWVFGVERDTAYLDIEECYVRPAFRRKGYGKALTRWAVSLAKERGVAPRFWIPHVDAEATNLSVVSRLLGSYGLNIGASGVSWSALVASTDKAGSRGPTATASRPRSAFSID